MTVSARFAVLGSTLGAPPRPAPSVQVDELSAWYGARRALNALSLHASGNTVTAVIGPSGCGKSTLLRCINRLHELTPGARMQGRIVIDGDAVSTASTDVIALRRRVGMVFQRPTPFPTLSIAENVGAGLRAAGMPRAEIADRVEAALRRTGLWPEIEDRLSGSALALSGGQQQRLCVARALATSPDVLLLDEPTASLDPVSTQRIEELMYELRGSMTIILVTHNLQQAARVADRTAFVLDGCVVEHDVSRALFTTPRDPRTEAYVTGRFG